MTDPWPDIRRGLRFDLDGEEAEITEICEEPNTGLVRVEHRGYRFTLPTTIVQSHVDKVKNMNGNLIRFPTERTQTVLRRDAMRLSVPQLRTLLDIHEGEFLNRQQDKSARALSRKGLAKLGPGGYELTTEGKERVRLALGRTR